MRWPYFLIGGGVLAAGLLFGVNAMLGGHLIDSRRMLRQYNISSESMSPALEIGDRIMPRRAGPDDIRRGTVVLIRVRDSQWVSRIAGLPGDTIQMRDGIVILNGQPVVQRPDGSYTPPDTGRVREPYDQGPFARLVEQFPGEPGSHRVLDQNMEMTDNTDVFTVPAGHLFMLGDNRDNAADSRFPKTEEAFRSGLGMVPITDVIGVVDFVMWGPNKRLGQPIDAPR